MIKQKKTEKIYSLPCAKTKAHGKEGTPSLPEKGLCRVLWPTAHGKGVFFAVCQDSGHAGKIVTLSAAVPFFLPSVTFCTWQSFCRVPDKKTHNKKDLCRHMIAVVFLPCAKVTVSRCGARPAWSLQYKTRLATLLLQSAAALDAAAELYCSQESWPVTEAVFTMLVRHRSCCCNVLHGDR